MHAELFWLMFGTSNNKLKEVLSISIFSRIGKQNCRIKTGHSNLLSSFGPRMRALAKVYYRGVAEVICNASARIWGPKHDTRFEWPVLILIMTRYPFFPFKTHKTSAKSPRLLSITGAIWFWRYRQCTPPHFECTHLLLRSADWWRHNILFSIACRKFESSVKASCQRIIIWIIRTAVMYID